MFAGPYGVARRVRRAARGADEQDADRRLPRLRPARGQLRARACSSTGWRGASASTRSSCGCATCCGPEDLPWTNAVRRDRTTAATTRAACAWPRTRSATRARRARPGASRAPTGGSSASACRRSSSGPGTRARASWPTAARATARTRASRCGPTAPAASTSTPACRRSARATETAFAQVVREVLGIAYDAVRVHAGDTASQPAQHRRVRVAHDDRGGRGDRDGGAELREKMLRIAAHAARAGRRVGAWRSAAGRSCAPRRSRRARSRCADVHDARHHGQRLPDGEEPGLEATAYFEPTRGGVRLRQRGRRRRGRPRDRRLRRSSASCSSTTPARR